MEVIRLVERLDSVGLSEGARGEGADDEREPLIPTPANILTAARFSSFAGLPESKGRTDKAERCDGCPDRILSAHAHSNPGPS